ncbi:MAG TPA: hypothetical protein P5079_05010 [Elusimicrobiota bacterium]|nr:hypothetical protein [Elusimicrobiota bacterium]
MEWVRAACRFDDRSLQEQLLVRSVETIPAWEVSLWTLLETRGPKAEEIVLSDLSLPGSAGPVPAPSEIVVWDHPSETRSDFSESSGRYPIAATLKRCDCPACGRSGSISCGVCSGYGKTACPNCRGAGKIACEYCKGLGKTNCLKCDGKGVNKGAGVVVHAANACDACRGAGKVACTRCVNGEVPCSQCAGAGHQPCSKCRANGKSPCPTCQGKGEILKGYGFQADFRLRKMTTVFSALPAPKSLLDAVFSQKRNDPPEQKDAVPLLQAEHFAALPFPAEARQNLERYSQNLPSTLDANTRMVRQRAAWHSADLCRTTGTFCGQEFVYWVDISSGKVVAEKDPVKDLSAASEQEAEKAWERKEWAAALSLARQTLLFEPDNPQAKRIVDQCRRRMRGESMMLAAGAATAVSLLAAGGIFILEKGLNRSGPVLRVAVFGLIAGTVLGWIWDRLAAEKFPVRKRRLASFFGTGGLLICGFLILRWGAGWNPVRSADEAAFQKEWTTRFPSGGPGEVYWEPDLRFLEELAEKYKGTQVDLGRVKSGIEKQRRLKEQRKEQEEELSSRLSALMADAGLNFQDKLRRLTELRDLYQLQSVNVDSVAEAIKKVEEEKKLKEAERPRGRISIVPAPYKRNRR